VQKLSGAVFCTRGTVKKTDNIVSNQLRIGIRSIVIWYDTDSLLILTDVTPNRHTGESRYPERLTAPDSGFCRNDGKCSILPGSEGSA